MFPNYLPFILHGNYILSKLPSKLVSTKKGMNVVDVV
jgi:hypothetical protein